MEFAQLQNMLGRHAFQSLKNIFVTNKYLMGIVIYLLAVRVSTSMSTRLQDIVTSFIMYSKIAEFSQYMNSEILLVGMQVYANGQ